MSEKAQVFTFEVNQENFPEAVLKKSTELPVLVDFWAPWCSPCRMLSPLLNKLAEEYVGKLYVVTVNTDQNQMLAREQGIRSIPTVKLFRHGQVIEQFMGVQTESAIKALIEAHLDRESDVLRKQAAEAIEQNDLQKACVLLQTAAQNDPENPRIYPDLANLLVALERFDEAERALDTLSDARRQDQDILEIAIKIKFARILQHVPPQAILLESLVDNPDDHAVRYQLSIRQAIQQNYEEALQNLLIILQKDRHFNEDAARKAILDIFTLLGGSGALVKNYRLKLAALLH